MRCAGWFFGLSFWSGPGPRDTRRTPPERCAECTVRRNSAPGALRGVYGAAAQPTPLPTLPNTVVAPDYGISERGPDVSMPGHVKPGESLPEGVKASPIPGRPGYGRVVINGRPAIIDMGDSRVVQFSD